jgi:TrmH family RNA methyltransferase
MPGSKLSRSEEKLLNALSRRRERARRGLFVAEGVRVAEEFLDAGIDLQLAVLSPSLEDTQRGQALARRLAEHTVTRRAGDATIAHLANTDTSQGIVLVGRIPHHELTDIVFPQRATVLMLDAIQDPGNFGTLVRSAVAFGAHALIALDGTVDPWNPKAVRAAAGASFRIPIVQAAAEPAFEMLHQQQFRILVADAQGSAMDTVAKLPRTALVVGNEGAGVSAGTRAAADAIVAVPTTGPVESLNVATAAGILLYLIARESAA